MTELRSLAGAPLLPLGEYALHDLDYEVEELLLSGEAMSYLLPGGMPTSGRWDVTPSRTAAFTTRIVVVRPREAGRFDGRVVLEWLNVSGGTDVPTDWTYVHREIVRRGSAWVGVSAQRAGVAGGGLRAGPNLLSQDPERYGALDHPGDAFAYDVFSQAAAALRTDEGTRLLGGAATQVLAVGESQSALFLLTYVNAVDPVAAVVDGVLLHGRAARGAWIDGALMDLRRLATERLTQLPTLRGHRVRDDARVPVMTVQSETDQFLLGGVFARQEDTRLHRTWEIAGAAHFDTYGLRAGYLDDGTLTPAALLAGLAPQRSPRGFRTSAPVNSGPQQHYVLQAALHALSRWVADGVAPPTATPLRTRPLQPLRMRRDERGIAEGGVRTPWVDVPLTVLSGLGQRTPGCGLLFGSTRPLPTRALEQLYPGGSDDYRTAFRAALGDAVAGGFLLTEDLTEIAALGESAWTG